MNDFIKIRGARQHNLKNISLDIPKNKFVVITGVSGSGKSSLAFDTIYAEGQRRYVESLSAYARQFLGVMDKPDVDRIDGLSPAISIDQKSTSHNPRSTVGTITEVYDFFRLLYARIGHPHCPNCGTEISKLTVDEIVQKIIIIIKENLNKNPISPHQIILLSPLVRQKKGEFKDLFSNLQSKGYSGVRVDGKMMSTSDEINLLKNNKHTVEAIIETLSMTLKDIRNESYLKTVTTRLTQDVEQSSLLSDGLVVIKIGNQETLFSQHFSCPKCNLSLPEIEPRMFSFNSPIGACPICKGLGTVYKVDPDLILNKHLSINEGGILPFPKFFNASTWYTRLILEVCEKEDIDVNTKIKDLPEKSVKILLNGTSKVYRVPGVNRYGRPTVIYEKFEGLVGELTHRYFEQGESSGWFDAQKYMREERCDICRGQRLKPEILSITIDEVNIADLSNNSVTYLTSYFSKELENKLKSYELQIAKPIFKEINNRLTFLKNVGLDYLTISRQARTLSGGELQRIRLASQIGTGLSGVLYVLDEPSIGLHPKDVAALIKTLNNLTTLGNTLIVVEHDRETIESASHIIELGPQAGKHGGRIVFEGTISQIKKNKQSLTGQFLSGKRVIAQHRTDLDQSKGTLIIEGAKQFNLKNITVDFPLGNLIAVTGVSGSGKSTLVTETLYPALKYYLDGFFIESTGAFSRLMGHQYLDRVYLVDQSPIGRTPRSNPATYVGFFDDIRDIFAQTIEAKTRGFEKSRFSFNLKGGRCEKCQGAGVIKIEMQFLADVYVTCDVCGGKRYNKETLEVTFKDKNIYEVLKMTVDEATEFFTNHHHIVTKLMFLQEVGLGYIELGQQAPTFSGGEAQRIKLVNELARKSTGRTLYILDEPTTGLHFYDIEKLLSALHRLVDMGNTVIIIEHNPDVIKNSQYVVDLGPDGGDSGGQVVYQGPLTGILKIKKSYTGNYLQSIL